LSHSTPEDTGEHWLSFAKLELFMIINIACGSDPKAPRLEMLRFLKICIDGGELDADKRSDTANQKSLVSASDFVPFIRSYPDIPGIIEPYLRVVAAKWAKARGISFTAVSSRTGLRRKRSPEHDAKRGNKIRAVLDCAKSLWPNLPRPTFREMARILADKSYDLGYDEESIRKILAGRHPDMTRMKIRGLNVPKS
jgi:hypothetical protein